MSLASPRATNSRESRDRVFPVAANVKIWQGAQVMLINGYATPGAVAAGGVSLGRAKYTADNTGGAAGAISVETSRGCFKWDNSATDAIGVNQVGRSCFIFDDHTVASTDGGSGARSPAGIVDQVDADGVWVAI